MTELPLWRASVNHGEVDFDAANDAAAEQARNIEYPWDQPLAEVSKVRERLLSDEAVGAAAAELSGNQTLAEARFDAVEALQAAVAAAFPGKETDG